MGLVRIRSYEGGTPLVEDWRGVWSTGGGGGGSELEFYYDILYFYMSDRSKILILESILDTFL